jgi:hypothetical protein
MTNTVTATFKDSKTITNVKDDLRSIGIPIEKIKIDKDNARVRVTVPEATKAEIMEVLNRHKPSEIH